MKLPPGLSQSTAAPGGHKTPTIQAPTLRVSFSVYLGRTLTTDAGDEVPSAGDEVPFAGDKVPFAGDEVPFTDRAS